MAQARKKGHQWSPISDLPARAFTTPGLEELLELWQQERAELERSDAVREFQRKLIRWWSIETGAVEQLYTLGEGITLTLVEQGFDASLISADETNLPPEQLVAILRDHEEAAEGLFAFVKGERQGGRRLSTSYIKELHQVLTRHQGSCDAIDSLGRRVKVGLLRGEYKSQPNNPGDPITREVWHQYCPPEQVASEMDRLVSMHLAHESVTYVLEAAWLHHRFTQIHPFQDGNGRVARALASLVCIRAGGFPVIVYRDQRNPVRSRRPQKAEYIGALQSADEGDLAPLVSLFEQQQKSAFLTALSLGRQAIEHQASVTTIIADAKRRLEDALVRRNDSANERALELMDIAERRLREVVEVLERSLDRRVTARVGRSTEGSAHWFRGQIVQTARVLGYFADLSMPKHWTRLRIRAEEDFDLVVSFHRVGRIEGSMMAATAFLARRERAAEASGQPFETSAVCEEPFTFTGGRDPQELAGAFAVWLEHAITTGLGQWRATL